MNSGAFRRFRSTANSHHVRRADHRVASETTARGRLADRSRFRNRIKLIRFVGQGESNETLARSADYWPHSLVFGFSVVAGEGRAASTRFRSPRPIAPRIVPLISSSYGSTDRVCFPTISLPLNTEDRGRGSRFISNGRNDFTFESSWPRSI